MNRGLNIINDVKRGTAQVSKIMRGTTLVWEKNNFILDQLSVQSAAAYSLRKLRYGYSGNAIRVRRSSDNTETDIGFVNRLLDTATLLSFIGSGSGFINIWYDQTGNGYNLTQTTAANQPRIVNAGVIDSLNSKPAIFTNDANKTSLFNTSVPAGANPTRNVVFSSSIGGLTFVTSGITISPRTYIYANAQINFGSTRIGPSNPINTPLVVTGWVEGFGTVNQYVSQNGTVYSGSTSRSGASNGLMVGALQQNNAHTDALIPEVICFTTVLSTTDRQLLELNQGQYYGITIP